MNLRRFISRSLDGNIKLWEIHIKDTHCELHYGILNGSLAIMTINDTPSQLNSRIRKKLKKGYIEITDEQFKTANLNSLLPATNKDIEGNLKPMLAQKFKVGTFNYPAGAQPKINGLRAFIIWGTVIQGDGMFRNESEQAVILSREGSRYVLPHIEKLFTKEMFENIDAFDGELYVPGLKLNEIKSCVPMVNDRGTISKPSGNPLLVQFWMFDVATEDTQQLDRYTNINLYPISKDVKATIMNPSAHYVLAHKTSSKYIILIPLTYVDNDNTLLAFANKCIEAGFEGAVVRDFHAEYAYGQRPKTMMKVKRFVDAEFEVLDIFLDDTKSTTVVKFKLRNDINDNTFEAMPMGTADERLNYYHKRENIIGKLATVKFYERSGVKEVPFHGNVVTIRDYE
jgi:hypothetical protein